MEPTAETATAPRDMELLHRLDEPTMRCCYCGNSRAHWDYDEECQVRVRNLARQLLTENASLSSKLARVREAAGAVDREFKWMLTNSLQYRSVFGSTLEALSTALAETEEEKADSESTARGRIKD